MGQIILIIKEEFLDKIDLIDNTFLTTDPKSLPFNLPNSFFIQIRAINHLKFLNNYKKDCAYDVFFAMSHGVHQRRIKIREK